MAKVFGAVWVRLGVVAILAVAVGACGSGSTVSFSPTIASLDLHDLGIKYGTPLATANGNVVTVYAVEVPTQPESVGGVTPTTDSARLYAALDGEVCAKKVPITDTSQADFNLDAMAGPAKHTDHPIKEPAFPVKAQAVPLGSCVRGWVSFELDQSKPVVVVETASYTDRSSAPPVRLSWAK